MALLFAPSVPVQARSVRHLRTSSHLAPRRVRTAFPSKRRYICSDETYDVVIIGSGLGGLSAGAILSTGYNMRVCVLEAHTIAGGAAHSFTRQTSHGKFIFDSGPSLFSGIAGTTSSNPLQHVLRAARANVPVVRYSAWGCYFEDNYISAPLTRNAPLFDTLMAEAAGPQARADTARLIETIRPLGRAATALPSATLRAGDALGSLRTSLRYLSPAMALNAPAFLQLSKPFGPLLRRTVKDRFAYDFIDLLCFLLAGVRADDIVTAEVAFMFSEWTGATAGVDDDHRLLEFPVGGTGAIVDALVQSIETGAKGSVVRTAAPVSRILVEGGAAVGVELPTGERVYATKCVMSNASVWNTARLLPRSSAPSLSARAEKTEKLPSFVHLHLALDMRGSSVDVASLLVNYIFVESWAAGVDASQNVVVLCVPSAADPGLAPDGHVVMHAYTPATEPYALYEGMRRDSEEYRALKKRRCQVLWKAVEKVVPDARERAHIVMEGTPLTHERFLSVEGGTYGPLMSAKDGTFPLPTVDDVDRLLCIGQSTFPGIGVPAVAASGFAAANSLVPVEKQLQLLDSIGL